MAHVINSQTQLIRNVNDAFLRAVRGMRMFSGGQFNWPLSLYTVMSGGNL